LKECAKASVPRGLTPTPAHYVRCPLPIVGVPKNNQGTIQKSFFVTFLKKGNAKNFYM
jgi:hypothetical protein